VRSDLIEPPDQRVDGKRDWIHRSSAIPNHGRPDVPNFATQSIRKLSENLESNSPQNDTDPQLVTKSSETISDRARAVDIIWLNNSDMTVGMPFVGNNVEIMSQLNRLLNEYGTNGDRVTKMHLKMHCWDREKSRIRMGDILAST